MQLRTSDTKSSEHKGNLRNSRESKNTLDIGLCTSHNSSIKRSYGTRCRNQVEHFRCKQIHREHTCNQIYTGNDHRGGMNQCRNRRRTFHSIRQPYMQREHCRFTGTTNEYQSQSPRSCRTAEECHPGRTAYDAARIAHQRLKVECTAIICQQHYTYKETKVGKTGNDESLLRSGNSRILFIVESNEKI